MSLLVGCDLSSPLFDPDPAPDPNPAPNSDPNDNKPPVADAGEDLSVVDDNGNGHAPHGTSIVSDLVNWIDAGAENN